MAEINNNYKSKLLNLSRKKSLSMSQLPVQNLNYLCVPISEPQQIQRSKSIDNLTIKKSIESLQKIESKTSLVVPSDYSFSSIELRVYKLRWGLLVLVILYTAVSFMQWLQYSIIANIVERYYGVSSNLVDWTSMVFMISYLVLVFPVSYFMDARGLKETAVIGSVGTAIGAWIKVFSLKRDGFLITFIGQTVVAISQVFVLSVPTRLASIWFKPEQMSSVCGLGVFGAQLGIAIGFLSTPWIVQNHDNINKVQDGFQTLFISNAALSSVLALLVVVVFKSKPKLPPSHIQALQRTIKTSNKGYWRSIRRIMKNKNYMTLVLSYGLNAGVFNALSTLLNQIVLNYFPNSEQDAGNIGMCLILTGLFGSIIFGIIMDTMRKFKETAVWVYGLTSASMLLFCLSLESKSKMLLYVASIVLGFFMSGYQPVGYEFASELTFPEPEGPVAGILNICSQFFGILITLTTAQLQNQFSDLLGNLFFCLLLIIGTKITNNVKPEMKRLSAHEEVASAAKELAKLEEFDKPNLQFKIDFYS